MKWLRKLLHRDRRRAARWEPIHLVAYYWDGSAPTPHRVLNLSVSGFQLESTSRWRPGTLITMTLQRVRFRGDSVQAEDYIRAEDYIVVISRVIWSDSTGAGLEFIPQEQAANAKVPCVGSPSDKQVVQQFLKSCHPDFTNGTKSANSSLGASARALSRGRKTRML